MATRAVTGRSDEPDEVRQAEGPRRHLVDGALLGGSGRQPDPVRDVLLLARGARLSGLEAVGADPAGEGVHRSSPLSASGVVDASSDFHVLGMTA